MLRKVFVEIRLKIIVVKSVSFFVLSVAFALDLQTLIGQMHIVILSFEIVARRASAKITRLVKVDAAVLGNNSPNSDVKLSSVE